MAARNKPIYPYRFSFSQVSLTKKLAHNKIILVVSSFSYFQINNAIKLQI